MDIFIKSLDKAYQEKIIFQNFSHTFLQNTVTAIMGPSGCGKTTLLSILMGLTPYEKGEILGLENRKIAAVFQEDRLCENLTSPYNMKLVLPKGSKKEDLTRPLMEAGLTKKDFAQPVKELSGGMKRRVAIMRALCAQSDLLIMDEPFQGLDDSTKEQMILLVKKYTRHQQVIWVTHSLAEAKALHSQILYL